MSRPIAFHLTIAIVGIVAVAGCGPADDAPGPTECAGRLAGDLVITEVMANPAGTDSGSGGEFFELFNSTSSPIDLSGISLVYEAGDDTSTHVIEDISIGAGDYLALGAVLTEFKPDYIDYGFANDLGSLRNGGATLRVLCADTELDSLDYPDMSASAHDGVSFGFDGNMTPDYLLNDNPINLCPATMEFAPGLFGSPGAPNESCEVILPGQCMGGTGFRAVTKPVLGDLIITELMPNPGGADGDREWLEIYAVNQVDLNGLLVGRSTTSGIDTDAINSPDCLTFGPDEYILVAKDRDALINNGLPEVDAVFGFSLLQSSGDVFLDYEGTILDTVTWASSTSNVSIQLDVAKFSATDNDLPENWCDGTTAIGNDDFGTPGAANLSCDIVPPNTCLDGGSPRALVPPGPGDVVISEYMANPNVVSDTAGEWIELQITAAVDLNGLQLGDAAAPTDELYNSPNCLRFNPGDFVLFAKDADTGTNGGLPAVDFTFSFALNNTNESINVAHGGVSLDTVAYASVTAGAAEQLDVDGVFCPAETAYGGDGNLGTPKAANDVDCP